MSVSGAVGLLSPLGMAYFDRMELLDVHHVVRHTLHVWALKPIYTGLDLMLVWTSTNKMKDTLFALT